MTAKVEEPEFRLDGVKWLVVIALVVIAVVGNSHFSDQPILYRVLGVLAISAIAVAIAMLTEKGFAFWNLLKSARLELRKVVWPTRAEANQTTFLVLAVVLVAALILTLIDSILGWLTSQIVQ